VLVEPVTVNVSDAPDDLAPQFSQYRIVTLTSVLSLTEIADVHPARVTVVALSCWTTATSRWPAGTAEPQVGATDVVPVAELVCTRAAAASAERAGTPKTTTTTKRPTQNSARLDERWRSFGCDIGIPPDSDW
jgi:hypothetical protein